MARLPSLRKGPFLSPKRSPRLPPSFLSLPFQTCSPSDEPLLPLPFDVDTPRRCLPLASLSSPSFSLTRFAFLLALPYIPSCLQSVKTAHLLSFFKSHLLSSPVWAYQLLIPDPIPRALRLVRDPLPKGHLLLCGRSPGQHPGCDRSTRYPRQPYPHRRGPRSRSRRGNRVWRYRKEVLQYVSRFFGTARGSSV
jgi:hypothetical protein